MKNKIKDATKIIIGVILLSAGVAYAGTTWSEPGYTFQSGNNVDAPINVGGTGQIKDGGLLLGNTIAADKNGLIVANGKVGIGTTNPLSKLQIKSNIGMALQSEGASDRGKQIQFLDMSGNEKSTIGRGFDNQPWTGIVTAGLPVGAPWDFVVRDENRYVGIGTNNPRAKLDVQGTVNTGQSLAINNWEFFETNDNISRYGFPSYVVNETSLYLTSHEGGAHQAFVFGDQGAGGGNAALFGISSKGSATDWTPSFILTGAGKVGIGTVTPAAKLDVNGTVKMTGFQLGTTATPGQVLTANASGVGTWQTPTTGGGGGITSLTAGTGITLTPNPITTTGTVAVNTTNIQSRVTGTCAAGKAISSIAANGTVTCVNIPPSALCTYSGRTYSTGMICVTGACNPSTSHTYFKCGSNGVWDSYFGISDCNSC